MERRGAAAAGGVGKVDAVVRPIYPLGNADRDDSGGIGVEVVDALWKGRDEVRFIFVH